MKNSKKRKKLERLESYKGENLNFVIGGITLDEATAVEVAKKGGTKGTSSTTGATYTDDKDGSNVVWS